MLQAGPLGLLHLVFAEAPNTGSADLDTGSPQR